VLSLSLSASLCREDLQAPTVLNELATPLWAQEYIGVDLIKAELNKMDDKSLIKAAVFDLGFEADYISLNRALEVPPQMNGRRTMRAHHGTSVVNILNGPEGITQMMDLMSLRAITYQSFYAYSFRHYEQNQSYPKVISNSLGWSKESIRETVELAHSKDILWFLAAGNDYPNPVRELEINSKALMVGSFSPSGLTSLESQNHPDLLILAPANAELWTINGSGEPHLFGATSGATPMVAGTVINILSLVPTLKREDIKSLLQLSSFKSAENKLGKQNYPGLLNGFKAFSVAKKVKEICSHEEDKSQCHSRELKDISNYQFKTRLQVTCDDILNSSCDGAKRKELINRVRTKAFLGNKDAMKVLNCGYKGLGFLKNAEYFKFLSEDVLPIETMKEKAQSALNQDIYQISYYRYLSQYGEDFIQFIKDHPLLSEYRKNELLKL